MAWWQKQLVWVGHILFLTAGAYFLADTVNLVIARGLEASVRPNEVPPSAIANRTPSVVERTAYQRILQGDLFHPSQRGQELSPPVEDFSAPLAPLELPLILVGAMEGQGMVSFAILEDRGTREQQVFRLKDVVRDGAILASVSRNQVVLQLGAREQLLTIYSDGTEDVAPPGPGVTPQRTVGTAAPSAGGIRQVQPNRWVLDKQEVNAALGNLSQLLTKARVVPNFTDGKPDGFKIFSIAPDSLYAKIGLQNGDVLQQINGVEVKDPENFMRVFQQLRDETHIALDFVRNSQRESYTYEIR